MNQVRVQGQGRAYAAVIGVAVGMLLAGLIVPLAFGRTTAGISAADQVPLGDLSFTEDGAGAAVPGGPGVPGASVPGKPGGGGGASGAGAPATGAAGSGSGSVTQGGTGAPGGASPSSGPLTDSDQGVTATTIKLGVVLLDIEALKSLGFGQPRFSPAEQQQAAQTYIDGINARGGILGRKVVPVYATLNALDSNGNQSAGAVCSRLAEDEKVFAVIGFLNDAGECLTQQFGIPAFNDSGRIQESYTKSRNFMISPYAFTERTGANWGDLAARSGLLEDRTLGTLYADNVQEVRPEAALVSALGQAGHDVAVRGKLSADTASAAGQMSLVVREMQTAGVDTVFLATNFVYALQFVNTAQNQGFTPQYVVSDLGSMTAEGLLGSMPSSFNGAVGFTQTTSAEKENAQDSSCRAEFNKTTGEDAKAGGDSASVRMFCLWTRVFATAAERAGTQLTRAGLVAAVQGLGRIPLPMALGGSYAAGKTDFADYLRPVRFDSSCRCYRSAGAAQQGRY